MGMIVERKGIIPARNLTATPRINPDLWRLVPVAIIARLVLRAGIAQKKKIFRPTSASALLSMKKMARYTVVALALAALAPPKNMMREQKGRARIVSG